MIFYFQDDWFLESQHEILYEKVDKEECDESFYNREGD